VHLSISLIGEIRLRGFEVIADELFEVGSSYSNNASSHSDEWDRVTPRKSSERLCGPQT
jgi:hypothetical protein